MSPLSTPLRIKFFKKLVLSGCSFQTLLFQIGSYFGSELCPVDVNGDGVTDVLLVAAPMYLGPHNKEIGRVYLYRVGQVRDPENQNRVVIQDLDKELGSNPCSMKLLGALSKPRLPLRVVVGGEELRTPP